MKVSSGSYYAYARGATYRVTSAQKICRDNIRHCFYENRRRYGSRRIAKQLQIGRFRVRKALNQLALRAIAPKRFKVATTDSNHNSRISPNLLHNGMNAPKGKGEVIVGDITYLPLKGGNLCYLACFQDKFTRRIVGWQVLKRMTTGLVIDALGPALKKRLIGRNAIIHTDRGSQYSATEYRRILYVRGYRQSAVGIGKEIATTTPKQKVSFPYSRQNYWKTASLNRSKMPNQRSSATSKARRSASNQTTFGNRLPKSIGV